MRIALLILFFYLNSFSQIVINSYDMPQNNNPYVFSAVDPQGLSVDSFSTGEDYLWDFSSLEPSYQYVDTFKTINTAPSTHQLFFGALAGSNSATSVLKLNGVLSGFGEFLNVEEYSILAYFSNNSTRYAQVGLGIDEIPLVLSEPDVLYRFPLSYDDSDTCVSSGQVPLTDITLDQERVSHVDGWGTLITPLGTYEVLRVVSVLQRDITFSLDENEDPVESSTVHTEYVWLAKNEGPPVMRVIAMDGYAISVTYQDSLRSSNVIAFRDKTSAQKINISRFGNIRLGQGLKGGVVSVYDLSGRVVFKDRIKNDGESYLNVRSVTQRSGSYIVRVIAADIDYSTRVTLTH